MIKLAFDQRLSQFVIEVDTELERDIAMSINGVASAGTKRWTLPAALPCWLEAQDVVLSDGGEVSELAYQAGAYLTKSAEDIVFLKTVEWPEAQLGAYTLKNYQEASAQFLKAIGSGAVTSDMRTGKTLAIFRTLELGDSFPALIATLPNTTGEIERQAKLAFPDKTIITVSKTLTAPQRKKLLATPADIYILGHNLLPTHGKLAHFGGIKAEVREKEAKAGAYDLKELDAIPFKAIVIDEGHAIENRKSQITRAVWGLGDKASRRIVCTGTIAANGDETLWPHLRFLFPRLFGARGKWLKRYLNMVDSAHGYPVCKQVNVVGNDGVKRKSGIKPDKRAEWSLIWDLISVRVERTDGPEKDYRVVPVELDKKALKAYRDMAEHGIAEVGEDLLTATDSMSLQHRLDEFASGTPVVRDGKVISLEMPSAKVDALLDLIKEQPDAKTIVVCAKRTLANLVLSVLDEKNIEAVALLGGMTQAAHAKAEDAFQNGDTNVIVINQAGAYGKELSKATRTIFLQRSYDYRFSAQAESRNTSSAQESARVEVIDVFAKGTLDEAVFASFADKDDSLHDRLKDKEWIRRSLYGTP